MFSPSCRESIAYEPLIFRGNSANPLFFTSGPFSVLMWKCRKSSVSSSLGQHDFAVERRVRGVVADTSVVFLELDKAGVFDAVGLGRRIGKDGPLGKVLVGRKRDLVVRLRQRDDAAGDGLEFRRAAARCCRRTVATADRNCSSVNSSSTSASTVFHKPVAQPELDQACGGNSGFSYWALATGSGAVTNRVGLSSWIWFSASITPVRNVIDEMCPSPVARRLRMNRFEPAGRPD